MKSVYKVQSRWIITHPSLYHRILVRQKTETKVTRLLSVECEAVHTLGWICRNKVLEEKI